MKNQISNHSPSKGIIHAAKSTVRTKFQTINSKKLEPKLERELLESGIPKDFHTHLNYFCVNKEEACQLVGIPAKGWVVSFKNPQGIHYLTSEGKPFYRLKPEKGELKGDSPPKYLSPKGEGCRPYFSPLLDVKHLAAGRDIFITEGEKKSDCLVAHGFTTIGLSGVDCWRDRRSGESEMLPELMELAWKGRTVFIVFDSDIATKSAVKNALKGLKDALSKLGAIVKIIPLPCELNGEKNGADDFIVRHGAKAFESLIKAASANTEEPKQTHFKALIALPVFEASFAYRPENGLHEWVGTHWVLLHEKPKDAIGLPLHKWMDEMGWNKRDTSHLNAVKDELLTRLKKTAWDRKYLMSFRNGTLNLKENNFTPKHNRYDYLTHGFNFNYDPVAKCPLWLNFLNETFENDQQVKQILRAAFRWTVSPKDISKPFLLELFFDLYGEKGCGKGTIQEVLTAVCGGDKARGIIRSTNIGNPTSRAALLGKKLAIDPDASGRMTDAGIFNSIVSNEPVEIKVLYINESFKRLGIVVWRNFNDQPSASGGGVEGMGRRMVTFRIKNRPTEPDPELKDKLLMEVSGIFQWCWSMSQEDMLETFKRRGEVKAISEASIENQLENQPVLRFLIDSFPDGDKAIKGSTLYESYKTWCNDEGCGVLSNAKFGKEAKKVKGLVLCEHTRYGSEYEIGPAKDFDLASHFGIKNNVGLNPSQNQPRHINPSPQKTREVVVSQEVVKGMKGLSPIFNFEKEKDSTNRKKETVSIRQTHHSGQAPLKTVTEQVNEAWDKGHKTEDSIFKNSSGLTRNEVKRTLKRQGRI